MKHNKNNSCNFPTLRFSEFTEQWKRTTINNECEINPTTPPLPNLFVYVDLEAVVKGELIKREVIEKHIAPSRAQRVLRDGDILFQCVRPYQLNNYLYLKQDEQNWVASTGYAQLRTEHIGRFIYQYLYSPRLNKDVMLRCTGTSYPAISSSDLGKIDIYICRKEEQQKIASLLSLIDERIATQSKIIAEYKKLKEALRDKLFSRIKATEYIKKKVKDILEYEQPTNYIVDTATYSNNTMLTPVLTANKAFILGYTDEKHNIYNKSECIIFDDFTMDSKFVDFPFKVKSSAIKILRAKESDDTYFISQYLVFINLHSEEHKRHYISEVESMCLLLPKLSEQKKIGETLRLIDANISNEQSISYLFEKQRQYLLTKMFI